MSKAGIIAGKAVIVVDVRDLVTKSLKGIQNQLRQFSRNVSRMSLNMTLFGGAASTGQLFLTKAFSDFEDSMLFLKTKLKTTDAQFDKLIDKIRSLGRTTSFTAQEVVEGAVFLAQAGFESKEIDNMLQAVLDLARGTRTELPTAARILSNALRTFDIDASQANRVVSQFMIGVDNGTLDLVALSEAMKEVQGSFKSLGVPLESAISMITALSSRSLRGTKAGTSLNAMILNLASNAERIKLDLGVDIADEKGNLRDVVDILEEIMNATAKMGNVKKTDMFRRLFNIRGGRTIEPLFSQMEKTLKGLKQEIRNASDEARKSAVVMDSGWGGAIRRATSALQDLNLTVMKIMTDALTPLVDMVPMLSNVMEVLTKKNATLVLVLLAIPPLSLALGIGFLVAATFASKLAFVLSGLGAIFTGIIRGATALAGAPLNILAQGFAEAVVQAKKFDLTMGRLIPDLYKKGRKKGQARPTSFMGKISTAQLKIPNAFLLFPMLLSKIVSGLGLVAASGVSLGFTLGSALDGVFRTAVRLAPIFGNVAAAGVMLGATLGSVLEFTFNTLVRGIGLTGTFASALGRPLPSLKSIIALVKRLDASFLATMANIGGKISSSISRVAIAFVGLINRIELAKDAFASLSPGNKLLSIGSVIRNIAVSLASVARSVVSFGAMIGRGAGTGLATLARFGPMVARSMAVVGGAMRGAFQFLMSGKIITYLYRFFMTLKTIASIALITARNILRFAFSWNGLFLALDILILLGDKIPVIKESLENFGNAFRNAFGELGKIGALIQPAFELIKKGFKTMSEGGANGFEMLSTGVWNIVEVIRDQLWNAWASFVNSIQDEIAFVYRSFMSLYLIFTRIVEIVGTFISMLSGGEAAASDFNESFRNSIGPIAKMVVEGIGNLIEGLSLTLVDMYGQVYTTLSGLLGLVLDGITGILDLFSGIVYGLYDANIINKETRGRILDGVGEAKVGIAQAQNNRLNNLEDLQGNLNEAKGAIIQGSEKFKNDLNDVFAQTFELDLIVPETIPADLLFLDTPNDGPSLPGFDPKAPEANQPEAKKTLEDLTGIKKGDFAGMVDFSNQLNPNGVQGFDMNTGKAMEFADFNPNRMAEEIGKTLTIMKDNFIGATTGSFGATRNALFKAASKEDKQIDLLEDIAASNKAIAGAF
jgi:TP901 family phage tail tape measure protein